MSDEYREREDKYDVDPGFALPDLMVDDSIDRVDVATYQLEATYFDTPENFLRQHLITLRKRTGGSDAGWHLKLPAESARTEIHVQSQSRSVPRELSALLLGIRRGHPLVPTVTISTTRNAHLLLDTSGRTLAEVADDTVDVAEGGSSAEGSQWREIEVELGPAGDERLLSLLGERLRDAGAEPSASSSKSARALGDPDLGAPRHKRLAGLVDAYLQAQYRAIFDGDLGLRRELNAVHTTRVAVRRLRSTLRTFGELFDPEAASRLETELVWIAGVLGAVRDLDILRDRLEGAVAALPAQYVLGPVASRLESTLSAERAAAFGRLRRTMNGKRYLAMLEMLESWRVDPPYTDAASAPRRAASSYVRKAERRMLKGLRLALEPDAPDELLHKARKAEKRYRYACELAQDVLGPKSEQAIKKAKSLQKLLGEFQDAVVSADTLRRLGVKAGSTQGENGFTYGLLLAQEWEVQRSVRDQVVRDYG
jgi:CHAD domain-containing protein